ncbi:hypothetical protein Slin15195_G130080 [Septoria linicola]|uniref:Uncharacterized protein n=1 Tax=Septoria linicola TaxID=215465 RepID=A0A9Q9B2E1_9PEZI|nr:hypothetical protein Slin14017_G121970 [Septoria linicola]USW59689.1 hypothetical protein Slin15195_G130080 [Septoria linicola]
MSDARCTSGRDTYHDSTHHHSYGLTTLSKVILAILLLLVLSSVPVYLVIEAERKQKQRDLAQSERRLELRELSLISSRSKLENKEAELGWSEASLNLREARVQSRESKLKADTLRLSSTQTHLDSLNARLEQKEDRLNNLEQELDARKSTLDTIGSQLKARAKALDTRDQNIDKIQDHLSSMKALLDGREMTLRTAKQRQDEIQQSLEALLESNKIERAELQMKQKEKHVFSTTKQPAPSDSVSKVGEVAQQIHDYIVKDVKPEHDLAVFQAALHAFSLYIYNRDDVRTVVVMGVKQLNLAVNDVVVWEVVNAVVSAHEKQSEMELVESDDIDEGEEEELALESEHNGLAALRSADARTKTKKQKAKTESDERMMDRRSSSTSGPSV